MNPRSLLPLVAPVALVALVYSWAPGVPAIPAPASDEWRPAPSVVAEPSPSFLPPALTAPLVEEDSPEWDCRTMGNRICGPAHDPASLISPVPTIRKLWVSHANR